tara:strand:- start:48 stop:650 length:603 start_codon:yes stop_codon:yes gene_type:complete
MSEIINNNIANLSIIHALDIGTTDDENFESSNFLIKNLKNVKIYKSISDQNIKSNFFSNKLNKSITDNFTNEEIDIFSSDLVISNATLEHVGDKNSQIKMIENVIKLSKKIFVITTPNRFYPIDFHTKIPLIHWLPKSIHRKILKFLGLEYFSKIENLNLMSKKDIKGILSNFKNIKYKIFYIKLAFIKSNFVIVGEIVD